MRTAQDALIGYLARIESSSIKAAVGGLLVTNRRGIPIEFRYTDPVEFSEQRRMLYPNPESETEAAALAIAASLWKSLRQKPRLLLVEELSAMRLWERLLNNGTAVTAHISRPNAEHAEENAAGHAVKLAEEDEGARLPDGAGGTIAVRSAPPSDKATRRAVQTLSEAAERMRIDEPFDRVERILRSVHDLPESETRQRAPRVLPHVLPHAAPHDPPQVSPPGRSNDAAYPEPAKPDRLPTAALASRPDLQWMRR